MLKIFIGYDKRESVAYHVLSQSIIEHCSLPFSVTPLVRNTLPVSAQRDAKASTDFADTRFLVPYLCDFRGWALFIDCDEMFTTDPVELFDLSDDKYAVMVRKHNHVPENDKKFLDQEQTRYKYKNWSSCMLFNNEKCKALTPSYVASVPGLDLHQFKWLRPEDEVGELPEGWNHLVNHSHCEGHPKLIHWTDGSVCFNDCRDAEYAVLWEEMLRDTFHCDQIDGEEARFIKEVFC